MATTSSNTVGSQKPADAPAAQVPSSITEEAAASAGPISYMEFSRSGIVNSFLQEQAALIRERTIDWEVSWLAGGASVVHSPRPSTSSSHSLYSL